jgi:hypothetical protein
LRHSALGNSAIDGRRRRTARASSLLMQSRKVAISGVSRARLACGSLPRIENAVRMSHRSGHLAAALFHGRDVFDRGESAVHRIVAVNLPVALAHFPMQRSHLSAVAAVVRHRDGDEHPRGPVGPTGSFDPARPNASSSADARAA